MLKWFRRKVRKDEPRPEAAPLETETTVSEPAVQAGTETDRPKRRRGTRGGRGRARKPAQATAEAQPPAARPERKPEPKTRRQEPKPQRERRRRPAPKRAPLPQAKRELVVSVDVTEQRVAVLEDDRVAEVYLERPDRRSIAGNIYVGTVDNVLPGMEAAFVEIGLEKNGFLYVDEIVVPELEGRRHGKKIQDLLSRGQKIVVQAVKDPMKSKGARLTTEISLPGRFLVFVPNGEGLGVSRRLEEDERTRLKEVLKSLDLPSGGVIVRTAAEGASAEDIERDLVFLQRLWTSIQKRTEGVDGPALVYQEAELPLRVVRDLFAGDFERAVIDHDRTYRRIVGYLKKTSPHMAARVTRWRRKQPLFEAFGIDAEIASTLSRRVDLPSGGYLIFDYAEAFTVIDVNTGRFVGSRSKTSTARLEDTITQNNLEAVKEVVRQLRLRDIGGIIVIDFIDMANPKNRATVEEALRTELERDRTKTYVVEISPLGLVEMTRQNVTEGPREILTKKCPTCEGDGIVLSEASAAVDAERRLRALAGGRSKAQAFRVLLNGRVASLLIGPGAERLAEIEEQTKRRFFLELDDDAPADHFVVLGEGTVEELTPEAPVAERSEVKLKLVEVARHDATAAVGKLDGYDVCVAGAAKLVGRKVGVRVERVLDGTAYGVLVDAPARAEPPITAETEAEKPTRRPRARAVADAVDEGVADEVVEAEGAAAVSAGEDGDAVAEAARSDGAPSERKRSRRGTRGGRRRRPSSRDEDASVATADGVATLGSASEAPASPELELSADGTEEAAPRIHVPGADLGSDGDAPAAGATGETRSADGAAATDGERPRKRTRRGSRGGRGRRKRPTDAPEGTTADPGDLDTPPVESEPPAGDAASEDWEYVPMSAWADDLDSARSRRSTD